MLETFIHLLSEVPWYWVLAIAFFIAFLENIFPPAPSDTILVFTGTLIGLGNVGFIPLIIFSTAGSVAGFALMFWLGDKFGKAIIDSNKFKFINQKTLLKPEEWFRRHGYFLIVANRFLSGTRAVISFFAGITHLPYKKTFLLSGVSALLWNAILLILGYYFGRNWELADYYMSLYGNILAPFVVVIILVIAVKWYLTLRKEKKSTAQKVN